MKNIKLPLPPALRARIIALQHTLDGQSNLAHAGEILEEIAQFYTGRLVPVIAAELRPLCSQPHQAVTLARGAECVLILPQLRARAKMQAHIPPTPANIDWLKRIFERTLRGQLHLGFDNEQEEA